MLLLITIGHALDYRRHKMSHAPAKPSLETQTSVRTDYASES